MKTEMDWEEEFDKIIEWNGHFGHNVEIEKKFLKKLAATGGDYLAKIEILDEYTIRITLPPQMSDARDRTLLLLLTSSPMPSECIYNKKKDQLTVEWHW